jgi:hypothetical protein
MGKSTAEKKLKNHVHHQTCDRTMGISHGQKIVSAENYVPQSAKM